MDVRATPVRVLHRHVNDYGPTTKPRAGQLRIWDVSVYVTDFEQRHLVPIAGSSAPDPMPIDHSLGGRAFTTASQLQKPAGDVNFTRGRGGPTVAEDAAAPPTITNRLRDIRPAA